MGQSEAKMWDCVYKNEPQSLRSVLSESATSIVNHRRQVTNPVEGPLGQVSPLHVACYFGYVDVVKVLLEFGGNPYSMIIAIDGTDTPVSCLDVARARGHTNLFPILTAKAVADATKTGPPVVAITPTTTTTTTTTTQANPYLTPAAPNSATTSPRLMRSSYSAVSCRCCGGCQCNSH
jgi:hypothetical protein